MTDDDLEFLYIYADNNMSIKATANALYYSRRSIDRRLEKIYRITGVDPRTFWGLCQLINNRKGDSKCLS